MKKKTSGWILILLTSMMFLAACSHLATETNDESVETSSEKKEWSGFPHDPLQKGDQGNSVSQLQEGLIQLGYDIEVTDLFDEATVWAITDFQLQHEELDATGLYDNDTKQKFEEALNNSEQFVPGAALTKPNKNNTEQTTEKVKIIKNPYDVLALINKEHALPSDYIPPDLVIPNVRFPFTEDLPKKQLRKVAAEALEELFKAADEAGLDLYAQSGYRSYERQQAIFASNVQRHGEDHANTYSARAGESEHQSGLTMDVTSPEVDFQLNTDFEHTKEGQWIQQNAYKYGFIIRYPKGKEHITKYQYEPWHLRYVGLKAAEEITKQNITLEEYLGAWHPNN